MQQIWPILSYDIREKLQSLPVDILDGLEEIRLRRGRPLEVIANQQSYFLTPQGGLSKNPKQGWVLTDDTADKVLNLISNHSLYALQEELKRGYVTVTGGHRVGITGKVLVEQGRVEGMKDIASFNIRVAREKKGVANPIIPYLIEGGTILNTLIISPPQCGKTTLLRDLVRLISYGNTHLSGKKVALVDERSEVAGCFRGIPQKDVGIRTDVLDGCPKAEGMMMMVRSMSPDVVVTDEIGREEDAEAVREILNAGVSLLTTVHGKDIQDILRRPTLADIMATGIFQRFVVLSRRRGAGTVEGICDQHYQPLLKESVLC